MIEDDIHALWHAIVREGAEIESELSSLARRGERSLVQWLGSPIVLRGLFGVLRRVKPVYVANGIAIVTRYEDVVEVLNRQDVFSVVPTYAAKMERTSGAFFLGMDDGPQYQREASICRAAFRPGDLERIRAFTAQTASALVQAARPARRLDVVEGLSHVVPARLVSDFFGVAGPDEATLMRWMRTIFREIFLNPTNDPDVAAAADVSSREMAPYLDALIASRKAELATSATSGDDFLTRLIRMQTDAESRLDDDAIRRNIGGIIVGAVDTVSKAIAQALDQLLDRPSDLESAQRAARSGDDSLLVAHTFEALRFNPHNPFVIRRTKLATTVAAGTPRETKIPAGVDVYAATLSTMFDDHKVTDPDEYRTDRANDIYLHFGHGLHTCFGRHVVRVAAPQIARAVLALPNLRRAAGLDGTMSFDGPFPSRLVVEFDP